MRPDESFASQPIRDLQTMLRVISEDDSRFPAVIPDGIYGPSTMNAVSTVQRHLGIPVTGIVDQNTWDRIVELYSPALNRIEKAQPIEILIEPGQVFRRGDSSPYIYLLQSMLTQLSKDHASISEPEHSGVMDDATILSLKGFQRLSSLPDTGESDRITWKNLVLQFTLNAHHHNRTPSDISGNINFL